MSDQREYKQYFHEHNEYKQFLRRVRSFYFQNQKHSSHQSGKFHIKLSIKSKDLSKLGKIEASKKIYKILDFELKNYIHSIQILIN